MLGSRYERWTFQLDPKRQLLVGVHVPAPPSSQMAASARQGSDGAVDWHARPGTAELPTGYIGEARE
jgi:hypothetical protein